MRLRRYCRRIRNGARNHVDDELNLVPMLDMFLSLIPFLLVSAAFLNYGGLFVEAPSFAARKEETPVDSSNSKTIALAVTVNDNRISILAYSQNFVSKIENLQGDFALNDSDGLNSFLAEMKKNRSVSSVLFHVEPQVRYQSAVGVLKSLRKSDLSKHIVLAVRPLAATEPMQAAVPEQKEL